MRSLETGMFGAYCNVLTNLENLSDHGHAKEVCCTITHSVIELSETAFWSRNLMKTMCLERIISLTAWRSSRKNSIITRPRWRRRVKRLAMSVYCCVCTKNAAVYCLTARRLL